jgi:DNA-binding transcriptional LysR family regulator
MIPGITFRQIETFYWITRLGSFSAAAARLATTQPAVSGRIRDLEDLLQVQLFDRSGRASILTPRGRDFLEYAERFISLGDELRDRLGLYQAMSGVVRVGAADTVALTWLPRLVSEISRRHPGIDVELVVDLSLNLQEKLRGGEIDIAFLVGALTEPDFETQPLGAVRNAWMCSAALDLPEEPLSARQLASWPVFTHSRGSHQHRMVQRWFAAEDTRPARLHGCTSLATMIRMTAAGLGVSVLPPALLGCEIGSGQLRVISTVRPLPDNHFVVVRSTRPPAGTCKVIADLAIAVAATDPAFMAPNREAVDPRLDDAQPTALPPRRARAGPV